MKLLKHDQQKSLAIINMKGLFMCCKVLMMLLISRLRHWAFFSLVVMFPQFCCSLAFWVLIVSFFFPFFFFWLYCSFSAFASYAGCFYKYLQLPSKRKWKLNKQYFIYLFSYLLCCAALMATGTNYQGVQAPLHRLESVPQLSMTKCMSCCYQAPEDK